MDVFGSLNTVLLGSGCQIYYPYKFSKILNRLQVLLVFLTTTCYLVFDVMYFKFDRYFLTNSVWSLYLILGFAYIVVLNRNRKYLGRFVTTLLSKLSSQSKKSLRRFCIISATLSWVRFIDYAVCVITTNQLIPQNSVFEANLVVKPQGILMCMLYQLLHNWRIGGCMIFIFFIKLIHESEVAFFADMECSFFKKIPSISPTELTLARRRILNFKDRLCRLYSTVPVFWYLQEFFYMSGVVISMKSSYEYNSWYFFIMMNVCPLLLSGGTLMYLCIVADTSLEFTRHKLDRMVTRIIERGETSLWKDFMNQVQEEKNFSYMAWSVFPMNKALMLSFVSSMITFTVLFIQLSEKMT